MRRPQPPILADAASQPRRFREAVIDLIKWIDSGSRTAELRTEIISDDDYLELVKPDGTRYRTTIGELRTHFGL